jgi:hypothetical protein
MLRDIFGVKARLQLQRRARKLALFNLAIHMKLRGCNLVTLDTASSEEAVVATAESLGRLGLLRLIKAAT